MACKQTFAILAALLAALPAFARATEHVVGDYSGWTTNFNYSAWAEGREFRVGDTLGIAKLYLFLRFLFFS